MEEFGSWLVYSQQTDGICCAVYVVYVMLPSENDTKKSNVLGKHHIKSSHEAAVQAAQVFVQSVEIPKITTIPPQTHRRKAENIDVNRHILKRSKSLLRTAMHCSELLQCAPGKNTSKEQSRTQVKSILLHVTILHDHDNIATEGSPTLWVRCISPKTYNFLVVADMDVNADNENGVGSEIIVSMKGKKVGLLDYTIEKNIKKTCKMTMNTDT